MPPSGFWLHRGVVPLLEPAKPGREGAARRALPSRAGVMGSGHLRPHSSWKLHRTPVTWGWHRGCGEHWSLRSPAENAATQTGVRPRSSTAFLATGGTGGPVAPRSSLSGLVLPVRPGRATGSRSERRASSRPL